MSNGNKVYVLCSRYSKASADFMNTVDETGIDFIVPIYIDNRAARDKVMRSGLNIRTVPCVIGSVNGFFATYEGSSAFEWLDSIVKQYVKQPEPSDAIPDRPETGSTSSQVGHKILNSKSIAEKMRQEREIDDELMHDKKRMLTYDRDQNHV